MTPDLIRRQQLGLTLSGPFSRNRRRRSRALGIGAAALTGLTLMLFFFL